jgi:hypothetical protein
VEMGYKYLADQNSLCFFYESGTYANASGNRQWIGLVQDHTPEEGAGVTAIRYQGSYNRNVDLFTDGTLEYTGKFTYYPQDFKFLAFAIGSVTETATAGSHLIRETNSADANYAIPTQSLSSFTLEDSKKTATAGSNFIRTLKGCMIDTLDLKMSEGEITTCDVGYVAQSLTFSSGTVTTATVNTNKPYMWSNIQIHIPSGTALNNCTEFSLNISNNLESRFPLNGSRTIEEVIPLNRDYEVSATFIMDASNAKPLYNQYYIGGSSFNSLVMIRAPIGSAIITMSGCRITEMSIPSPVEGLHEQTCTIMPTNVYVDVYDSVVDYNAW